jgi:hypothetical protein
MHMHMGTPCQALAFTDIYAQFRDAGIPVTKKQAAEFLDQQVWTRLGRADRAWCGVARRL